MASVNLDRIPYRTAKGRYYPAKSRAERMADKLRPTLKEARRIKLTKAQIRKWLAEKPAKRNRRGSVNPHTTTMLKVRANKRHGQYRLGYVPSTVAYSSGQWCQRIR